MPLGTKIAKKIEQALKQGIINKREYNEVLKAQTGRKSNQNTASQNIILGKVAGVTVSAKPKTSIKQNSTYGGYVGNRQKVARQRESGATEKEIRSKLLKEIQPVFDAANKRLKRLADVESEGISLPALKALRKEIPTGGFSVTGKDTDEIIKLYRIAVEFMNHSTSTIKGATKHIQDSIATFGGSPKQATARRRLVDDMLNDKIDMTNSNYADFTNWISHNIKTTDNFNESEVRKKVEEIEEKRRQLREKAIEQAKELAGKPQVSSSLLRDLLS